MPPGTKVRRSRAGKPGLISKLAWALLIGGPIVALVIGYLGAAAQEDSTGQPGTEPLALAIVVATGLTAGALFALARDSRGRGTRLWKVVGLPIGLALLVTFGPTGESFSEPFSERLLFGLVVLLATGLPPLAAYLLTPRLLASYRSGRVDLTLRQDTGPTPKSELAAATDGGEAVAVLREYSWGDEALISEDGKALNDAGYEIAAMGGSHDWSAEEKVKVVLYVKRG